MGDSSGNPWYTKDEIRRESGRPNERGLYCRKCHQLIPQFADLTPEDESRVRELIRNGRNIMAVKELAAATGCDLSWAKVWVNHRGNPEVFHGVPCPYCGAQLRSSEAKQCRNCLRDWHDESNVLRLGTADPWPAE